MTTGRPLSESDFLRQVIDLAEIYHWRYVHFRPAQTTRGWRTPVQGPLGKGWPDLILVKGDRLMAVELKAEKGPVTAVGLDDCQSCGKPHSRFGDGKRKPSSWADPVDGHAYVHDPDGTIRRLTAQLSAMTERAERAEGLAQAYLDAESQPAYSWVHESEEARREGRPNREIERMERIWNARDALAKSLSRDEETK